MPSPDSPGLLSLLSFNVDFDASTHTYIFSLLLYHLVTDFDVAPAEYHNYKKLSHTLQTLLV